VILDTRFGLAGELVQKAAPPPGSGQGRAPSRAALAAAAAAVDKARRDWSRSVQAVGGVARGERSLSSRDRRAASDLAWHVVRGRRLLGALLGEPDGDASSLDLVRAAAVLWDDAPRELVAPSLRDGLDDPRHALLSWVRRAAPSPAAALGCATSLPDWFADELLADHPPDEAIGIAASLLGRAPLTLRVHRDRTSREAALAELAGAGIEATPSPLSPDGIDLGGRVNVRSLGPVQRGEASVQDAGSQRIAAMVEPAAGERILDACAGAGGKTLAMASLAPGARILGTDVRRAALDQAASRAREAGLSDRLRFLTIPPSGPLPEVVSAFAPVDAVLIDAPCTGSGSLRREPHARWSRSPLEVQRLPALQGALLDRFAPLVKPGGRLLYATCSLFRRENESVVRDFLGRNSAFARSENDTLALRPDLHGCDGFFAALLLRAP
jgi:16S rRNA (cytosine967-C5)-methyltransferase